MSWAQQETPLTGGAHSSTAASLTNSNESQTQISTAPTLSQQPNMPKRIQTPTLQPLFRGQYYTGGFDAPIPGVPGRWEFMTMGQDHASAEFQAHMNLGGQGHLGPGTDNPTAEDVYGLRQYNRAHFGNDGNTEGIDIVWIADRDRETSIRDASHRHAVRDNATTPGAAPPRQSDAVNQTEQQVTQQVKVTQETVSEVPNATQEPGGPANTPTALEEVEAHNATLSHSQVNDTSVVGADVRTEVGVDVGAKVEAEGEGEKINMAETKEKKEEDVKNDEFEGDEFEGDELADDQIGDNEFEDYEMKDEAEAEAGEDGEDEDVTQQVEHVTKRGST